MVELSDTIMVALITGGFTLMGVFIANLITLIVSNNKVDKPAKRNILEEQYIKVFAPMHKALHTPGSPMEEKQKILLQLLSDNYHLVPTTISKHIQTLSLLQSNTNKIEQFEELTKIVCTAFEVSMSKLGYSQVKIRNLSKEQKEVTQQMARKNTEFHFYTWLILAIVFISIGGTLIVFDNLTGIMEWRAVFLTFLAILLLFTANMIIYFSKK